MHVTFVGGPLDGQTHVVEPEPSTDAVINWPPGSDATPDRADIPGEEGTVEYIYEATAPPSTSEDSRRPTTSRVPRFAGRRGTRETN
jgi:hypothetical protein